MVQEFEGFPLPWESSVAHSTERCTAERTVSWMVELVLKPGVVVDSSSTPCGVTSLPMARTTCGPRKVDEGRRCLVPKLCFNIDQSGCAGSIRRCDTRKFLNQQIELHAHRRDLLHVTQASEPAMRCMQRQQACMLAGGACVGQT